MVNAWGIQAKGKSLSAKEKENGFPAIFNAQSHSAIAGPNERKNTISHEVMSALARDWLHNLAAIKVV